MNEAGDATDTSTVAMGSVPDEVCATPERWRACQELFEKQQVHLKEPTEKQRALADQVMRHIVKAVSKVLLIDPGTDDQVDCTPLLARIDLLPIQPLAESGTLGQSDNDIDHHLVEWVVSEIEVFGPEMFFRAKPGAADDVCGQLAGLCAATAR